MPIFIFVWLSNLIFKSNDFVLVPLKLCDGKDCNAKCKIVPFLCTSLIGNKWIMGHAKNEKFWLT